MGEPEPEAAQSDAAAAVEPAPGAASATPAQSMHPPAARASVTAPTEPPIQGSPPEQARIRIWLSRRPGIVPGWVWPPAVVLVTAWLGEHHTQAAVAYWLALVAGCVSYVLVHIALEPEPYARTAAAASGVVVGLGVAAALLDQVGSSLL